MKIRELKISAKQKLSSCFKLVITINFFHLIITLALSFLDSKTTGILQTIIAIIIAIINIALGYGLTASMLKLSRNENVEIADFIKIGFKNFKRALFLSLSILVRLLIPIILISAATLLPSIQIFMNIFGVHSADVISIFALVIIFGGLIYLFYKILSYALSTYLLIDNPELTSKEILKTSAELMKGNKLKFIGLVFSFFGWLLVVSFLGVLAAIISESLGTLVIYGLSLLLTPYITFSEINFYEDLVDVSKN